MSDEVVTRICFCPDRVEATEGKTFVYSTHYGGWYDREAPDRTMSDRVYEAVYFERKDEMHEHHAGEPYIHTECPWCGNTLPMVRFPKEGDDRLGPTGPQADGGGRL